MIQKPQSSLSLFFPGNIEYLLFKANNSGNMAWYGNFLRMYYTRNLVYVSIPILYLSYYYNCTYYGLTLFLLSFLSFRNACYNSFKFI